MHHSYHQNVLPFPLSKVYEERTFEMIDSPNDGLSQGACKRTDKTVSVSQ